MDWLAWLKLNTRKEGDNNTEADNFVDTGHDAIEELAFSGPFSSSNLSVFLIRGKDSTKGKHFVTLEEALEKKQVVVEETGNVSELRIKNKGKDTVFLQSGDILKGGRQDRTLQFDMILTADSGFVPVKSFCVEHGRWSQRGVEDVTTFTASHDYLSHKSLRMAAKHTNDQNEVWKEVLNMQTRTASNTASSLSDIQDKSSPSSLQLTLESEKVQESIEVYLKELAELPEQESDIIGYAFAINGEVNNIDVYSSNALFKKMWPKLIKAAAVEALAERQENKDFEEVAVDRVKTCMQDAEQAKARVKAVSGQSKTILRETAQNVLFETRNMKDEDGWVHRNYASKT